MKTEKKRKAQLECANWHLGNCLGCMIHIDRAYLKRNNWVPVFLHIDKELQDKPCIVDTKEGCQYFKNFMQR